MSKQTKKQKYLLKQFKLDEDIVNQITKAGELLGTHKYDIWIAKECKKDYAILSDIQTIRHIIDWASVAKPDITRYSFIEATDKSAEWHEQFKVKEDVEADINVDDKTILYMCKDKAHYFKVLRPDELEKESDLMGNCVRTFREKIRSERSVLISLRDSDNVPHVDIEIDVKTGMTLQTYGKSNSQPKPIYQRCITEFAIYASGYDAELDDELMQLINLEFNQ